MPAVGRMGDSQHRQPERLSRQQAAERLVDIAYALTAGRPLELPGVNGRVRVPVGDALQLARELKSDGVSVALVLTLNWPAEAAG